jgi:toxin FitB
MSLMHAIIDGVPKISVIAKIEILRFNTSADAYKILEDFINESIIFDLSDEVVEKTITICKAGKVKLPDAIIAATALVHDLTLITRNLTDFKQIGLQLLNPWVMPENEALENYIKCKKKPGMR